MAGVREQAARALYEAEFIEGADFTEWEYLEEHEYAYYRSKAAAVLAVAADVDGIEQAIERQRVICRRQQCWSAHCEAKAVAAHILGRQE